MTRDKFIAHQPIVNPKHRRISLIISNILLLTGSLVIVLLLGYLFFNLDKSDSLVNSLLPFFFVGIGFIIISQVICPFQFKSRR